MKKIALSLAVMMLGVTGVMNVALAEAPDRVSVCVTSNGQGSPGHEVEVPEQAADAPAFSSCGGGAGFGGFGRLSAADVNDNLANTK